MRRWWHRVPGVVLGVMLAQLVLGAAYAGSTAVWAAPDEQEQVSTIIELAEDGRYPAPGDARLTASVVASRDYVPDAVNADRTDPAAVSAPAVLADPLPSFAALSSTPAPAPREINQITQHAPAFAIVMAAPWWTLNMADWPLDLAVLGLRLVNVLMIMTLPPLIWLTARRLGASRAAAGVATAVPLLVPQLTWWSGTINNDHLVTVAMGVLTYLGVRITTGDQRWTTWAGAGAALGVGLFTKSFALSGIVVLGLVALAGARRGDRRALVGRLALGLGVAFLLGGWWYVQNLLRYGTLQPSGTSFGDARVPDWGFYLSNAPSGLLTSYFWSPGTLENPLPLPWALLGLGALLVPATVGVVVLRRRGVVLALLAPLVLTLAIITFGSVTAFADGGVIRGMQGRYLYVGIVGLAALVAVGLPQARRFRWMLVPTAAVVVVVHVVALSDVRLIFSEAGPDGANLAGVPGWLTVTALLLAAGALVAACAVEALRAGPVEPVRRHPTRMVAS